MIELINRILKIFLPPRCIKCGAILSDDDGLCPECFNQLNFITAPYCYKCGHPFEEVVNKKSQKLLCGRCSKKQKTPKCRHGQKTGRHSRKRMFCPARLHLVRWECLCRRLIADSTVQTNRANHFGLWQGLRSKAYATGRCRRNPRLTLEAGFLWSNGGRLVF